MTMLFQERLNLYEIAQETIGFMMAIRTEKIHEERRKLNPDVGQIAKWTAEFDKYRDEQHELRLDDVTAIQRVLDEYCPLVKADFERSKAEA